MSRWPRPRSPIFPPATMSASASPTPAAASRPSISTGCSSPSSPPRRSARAPASASARSSPSRASRAATSPSNPRSAAAPRFRSTFPARPRPPSRPPRASPRQQRAAAIRRAPFRAPRSSSSRTIPRVSHSTVYLLEELGYRPQAVASGREALEVLARDPDIVLVLTDVMMPEMTGTELAAEVVRRLSGDRPAVRDRLCRRSGRRRRPCRPAHIEKAVHGRSAQRGGGDGADRTAQRIAPRRNRRGSRIRPPRIGQRRCHGLTTIFVPAWRLIFQAR